nr:MAG TPA: hypothetical protein [Caudoviricetes sp.]
MRDFYLLTILIVQQPGYARRGIDDGNYCSNW